jgi:hypothetical protein
MSCPTICNPEADRLAGAPECGLKQSPAARGFPDSSASVPRAPQLEIRTTSRSCRLVIRRIAQGLHSNLTLLIKGRPGRAGGARPHSAPGPRRHLIDNASCRPASRGPGGRSLTAAEERFWRSPWPYAVLPAARISQHQLDHGGRQQQRPQPSPVPAPPRLRTSRPRRARCRARIRRSARRVRRR